VKRWPFSSLSAHDNEENRLAPNAPPKLAFSYYSVHSLLFRKLGRCKPLAATNIEDAVELISYAQICAPIVEVRFGGRDCSVCGLLEKESTAHLQLYRLSYSSEP